MSQLVPTTRTVVTMQDYARSLIRAWPDVAKAQAGVLWAQFGIETGAGGACWNWNLGNVKHVAGDGFDYMALRGVWEIVNGQRVELPPTDPGAWFRSYPNLDAAMVEQLALLRKRFAPAWPAVLAGDVHAFAHELRAHGYYTAPEDAYVSGMLAHLARWNASSAFEDAAAEIASADGPQLESDGGLSRQDATSDAITDAAEDVVTERSQDEGDGASS